MSFIRRFSLTFLTNVLVVVIGALNYIVIVRTCGADGQGLFTLVLTSASLGMIFLGAGAILEANRYLAKKYRQELAVLFSATLIVTLAVGLFLFLWYVLLRGYPLKYFLNNNIAYLVALGIPFLFIQEANKGLLWGLERIDRHNLVNLFRSSSLLISNVVLLILLHKTIEWAIAGWLLTLVVVAFISIYYVIRELGYFKLILEKQVFFKLARIGWRTFLISVLFLLSLRVDVYIIKLLLDNAAVGYYSVVVLIASLVTITPTIGGMLIFNKAVSGEGKGISETAKLNRVCTAYALLVCVLLLFFGKYLITFLFGADFIVSYSCLIYFLPALVAQNIVFVISMFICGREGFPVFAILSLLSALVVNIILNFALIPVFGINGAAISASIALSLRAIMNIFYFRLRTKLAFSEFMILRKIDLIDLRNRLCPRTL